LPASKRRIEWLDLALTPNGDIGQGGTNGLIGQELTLRKRF
jgi:hypothetical protein